MIDRDLVSMRFATLVVALATTACGATTLESHSSDVPDAGRDDARVVEASAPAESPPGAPAAGACLLLVANDHASPAEEELTPAGTFVVDASGALRNAAGRSLVGFRPSADGARSSARGPLVAARHRPERATTRAQFVANLSSSSTTPTAVWNLRDPVSTSNHASSMAVYDSRGATHQITLYYRMSGPNRWDWYALTRAADTTAETSEEYYQGAFGTLTFNTSGALDTEHASSSTWSFVGAAPEQVIDFDFGTSISTEGGTGRDGVTQFASAFNDAAQSQDGVEDGEFERLTLTPEGEVLAWYSNRELVPLGWVTLVRLWTPRGLRARGADAWAPALDPASWTAGVASTPEASGGVSCTFARATVADGVRVDLAAAFFGG